MRFEGLLIHQCTFIKQNVVIGQDDYGRDIYGEEQIKGIKCRFDKLEKRVTKNDNSIDTIIQPVLYLAASQEISETVKIKDIADQNGISLLPGIYEIQKLTPVYGKIRVHHYEVELKKGRN
ncbi:putative minor capsid protein [Bacillus cereus]|uniref:putative minor capsid protein n=1 Tax=Bacillus cereus TaxID=1396 RepID=UPI0022EC8D25|nr:putative minor capsid protein [Bacillus cereus]MDA4083845.1 putative minor capsid protein [Bacillus cereus]